jgi:hypothetical protein
MNFSLSLSNTFHDDNSIHACIATSSQFYLHDQLMMYPLHNLSVFPSIGSLSLSLLPSLFIIYFVVPCTSSLVAISSFSYSFPFPFIVNLLAT